MLQAGADNHLSMEESLDLEQCLAHAQAIMWRYMMNGSQRPSTRAPSLLSALQQALILRLWQQIFLRPLSQFNSIP